MTLTWPCAARAHVDLAPRTTLKVGGRAEWLLEPATPEELAAAYTAAREAGFEPRILGGGANLIIQDGLLEGVVLSTERLRRTFRPLETTDAIPAGALDTSDDAAEAESIAADARSLAAASGEITAPAIDRSNPRLVAWAGASIPGLVRTASELGWTGLEGLIGVPGSLGGGITMNAGGRWGELFDVVELVRVIGTDGELRDVLRADCQPSYRDGGLAAIDAAVVVGAVLCLELAHKKEVKERAREYLFEKRAVQPVTEASAGCIFKNPTELFEGEPVGAGLLIDRLGLKDRRRGAARVSPIHGNFIINEGGATATDVLALIHDLQREVEDKTGIQLEIEVKCW
jgi:UDP-N-acetylmuramate dehydrogenase